MNPSENFIRYCNERNNTRIKEMEKKINTRSKT